MSYYFKINKLSYTNFLKFILFLTFIDFILFSIHRILITFNVIDPYISNIVVSNFTWSNYMILFSVCLFTLFYTLLIFIFTPMELFKININKKTFFILLFFLFISSVYIFFVQQNYKIRYTSGSITTFDGLLRIINTTIIICTFIVYQLHRKKINILFFYFIIVSSLLTIDGFSRGMTTLSMIVFEFYRLNDKKNFFLKLLFIIFGIIFGFSILYYSFYFKYSYVTGNFVLLEKFSNTLDYINNFIFPRISVHSEQLYSFISGDLAISNYDFLFKVVTETFNNRLKVIFNNANDLFYPKTVGQSISFSMFGPNEPGGSSPGYVLSAISFFPFTLPLIFLLVSIFKEISFKLNERVNLIQVACLCFILKGISANLLDMLGIIDTDLFLLFLVYLSCHINFKDLNKKKLS